MPNSNIIDALYKLRIDLIKTLSVSNKIRILSEWKYQKLLRELLFIRFSEQSVRASETIKVRPSKESDPSMRLKGLLEILKSNAEDSLDKLNKLKSECYKKEWKVYTAIMEKGESSMFPGITAAMAENVVPGIYIKPTGFMKCHKNNEVEFPILVEPKLKGVRVKVIVKNNVLKVYSSSFEDITKVFDETLFLNRGDFEIDGIVNCDYSFISRIKDGIVEKKISDIFAFDIIFDKPLIERKKELMKQALVLPLKVIPFVEVKNKKELYRFKHNCEKNFYLGVICKKIDSLYKAGYSKDWIDLTVPEVKEYKVIEILKDQVEETCCALIVQNRQREEFIVRLRKSQCDQIWCKRNQDILGKIIYADENMVFIGFNLSK